MLLQARTDLEKFGLGPGKSAVCHGIVLEFCKIILENMNKSLKKYKNTTCPFRFMGCAKKNCVKIAKKLNENR